MIAEIAGAELRMLTILAVGYCFALIVHEAGHAAMMLAVRFDVRMVRIGTGPLLLRARLGKAWLVLRGFPIQAFVMALPPPAGRRASQVAVTAAGALANLVCCLLFGGGVFVRPAWLDIALLLALTQAAVIVGVLLPSHTVIGGARLASDGLRIWYLLTRPGYGTLPALHALLMQDVVPAGAAMPPPSAASAEIAYQVLRPDRLADDWAAQQAAAALRGFLQQEPLPPLERAFVLTFLALSELLFSNTGATAAELDRWSLEALALTAAPLPRIVRGGVLLESGSYEAAEACLLEVKGDALENIQPALVHAFLARAFAGQGRQGAARQASALALAAMPKPHLRVMQPMFARIETALNAPAIRAASGMPALAEP